MNNTDYNLITFKSISEFVKALADNFGNKNHSLKLYEHLINKTTLVHEKAISKHIQLFREFCINNRDAITHKDISKLTFSKVEYSTRVYIDFSTIFNEADDDSKSVIWKYLLTISALVDPAGQAKKILQQNKDPSNEANFLNNIIEKVEANVNKNSNPLEAVGSLMSSGVFNELINGMNTGVQSGELDIGKLMGTVQTMCSGLSGLNGKLGSIPNNADNSNNNDNPLSMINNLMSCLNTNNTDETGVPDLSNITNLLSPMLSGLVNNNKNTPTVEEINSLNLQNDKLVKENK